MTTVLSRCVDRIGSITPVDAALARSLLVADRHYLLLKLREATFGPRFQGAVPCPWPDCGEQVGIAFTVADVPVEPAIGAGPHYELELSPDATPDRSPEARRVVFRLPNGGDQERLSPLLAANEAAALTALLAACVVSVGGEAADAQALSPRARQEIEREMERVAPRVELVMTARCVECGREFSAPFDLPSFFFGELRVTEEQLVREVHYLAFHYHWSEDEIMGMTRDRRRRYIDVLADEIERVNAAG